MSNSDLPSPEPSSSGERLRVRTAALTASAKERFARRERTAVVSGGVVLATTAAGVSALFGVLPATAAPPQGGISHTAQVAPLRPLEPPAAPAQPAAPDPPALAAPQAPAQPAEPPEVRALAGAPAPAPEARPQPSDPRPEAAPQPGPPAGQSQPAAAQPAAAQAEEPEPDPVDEAVPRTDQLNTWINEALHVLVENGHSLENMNPDDVRTVIMHESGGNPSAINRTDSNAAKGTPSKGLMQTIDPTFRAWALPGHRDVYDPVDNIIAGVRYSEATYGSVSQVPGISGIRGGGSYRGY